jgi:ectoine hydroxylase-related dioxygenase (phytanoyl-CoA dioxygenase family)
MNMLIADLVGESLGLHFNLSRFTSTERGWHQDEYLNPPETYGRYVAAWVAVDEIPEASGPFEFVEQSHKLPTVSREKVMPFLKQEYQLGYSNDYDWSGHSAMFVNPAYFFKFTRQQSRIFRFLGKKGDVLLWHSRLIHRGAPPADRTVLRPGIIGHYSPIRSARWFGQDIRRYGAGGYYWNFDR